MEELAREASSPALALEYLYQLAGVLGSELQRLSDLFGPSAVAGLVPQVVCLLELLEALAAAGGGTGDADGGFARKTELAEALYLAVHNRQRETGVGIPGGDCGEPGQGRTRSSYQVIEQKLSEAQKREQLLQIHLAQLEEENQRLLAQLAGSQSQDSTLRKEREVMLRLKEVVDKQRDEIRAQAHEILLKAGDTEALQEQLNRFMSMNEELRHKLAVVQMQLKKALEKTEALESVVLETRQELSRLAKTGVATESSVTGMEEGAVASGDQGPSPRTTAYSKEELQQILQERNELKTNLFLVQEELAYYQRELLNDERIPSLLLDAMKSTIKKQRKKIRAKMLGTVEEPVSSDEEEEGVCLTASGSDCVDGHLPESRIKSFFGLWYGSNSSNRSSSSAACPEPWEIVGPQDTVITVRASSSQKPTETVASSRKRTGRLRCQPSTHLCRPLLIDWIQKGRRKWSGRGSMSESHPQVFTCCLGWKQKGQECTIALCQGADACQKDEVCVRPGVCRCKPGFFGANCNTRCPDQYWGPDCKESCRCYPHGKCDPVSGECTCHPNRWGRLCQFACQCGPRGRCDPLTGACQCEPGWWAPDCKKQCSCNLSGSRCDSATGLCLCHRGWWGKRCAFHCTCNGSPCAPESGRCECRAGLWGAVCQHPCHCLYGTCSPQDGHCTCEAGYRGQSCTDTCPAGTYGPQCRYRCGHCKHQQACAPVDGSCLACESGWDGTHCNQSCPPGRHGENCTQPCPHCLQGETCHPETGKCRNCEPGLTGDRCEVPCPPGLFGDGCRFSCLDCINGSCDPVSGECVCQAGFWGISCNETCPEGFHGPNCSEPCQCRGAQCHPLTGDCQLRGKNQEALIAGILTPLLLLLLCICCCCFCCCGSAPMDPGDRAAAADGNPVSRMKHHVLGALANLSSTLPCFSLGGYKLPRVTVSHHDAEIPFNPSFIEPPSAAWPLDSSFSSSFDTDNEDDHPEGPVYQLPAAPDAELQPGFLPEASALNLEPFAIPRTSSIAKAKRPSVSFAEGTRFEGQTRGSTETLNPLRKSKASWGLARVASPQQEILPDSSDSSPGNIYENVEAGPKEEEEEKESHRPFLRSTPGGRRKRISGSRNVAQRVEALEAASKAQDKEPVVTTIYMTVGKAAGGSEGPVQAILLQLGSLQRAKQPPRKEPRLRRSLEGLQNPTRRMQDLEKSTRMLLTPDKTDLETTTMHDPELATMKAEGQGLLGGLPAPSWEETGESKSCEITRSHNQPERVIGGGALEEKTKEGEPKYENVSGLVQYPLAT